MNSQKQYNKMLILGISGMDYKISKGLIAAGKLPMFNRLAEQGSFIKLDACIPAENSVTWISISTGLNPGKHNVFDAVNRNSQTYTPELVSSKIEKATETRDHFKEKTVWRLISEAGLYTSAAHWPLVSTPIEMGPDYEQQATPEQFLKQILELEKTQERIFWQEYSEFQKQEKGFIGFRFDALNQLQHLFWNNRSIGKDSEKLFLNKAVVDYYQQKDSFLQQIMEKIDDQMILLVVSNHGITSSERSFHLNTWLVENCYMQLTKELTQIGESPLFKYVDWDTTRVYAVGFTSVYLNLEQREGKGIVQDKEPLLKELITKLEQIIDPKTGERIIHKVNRKEEIYSGNYLHNAPDLIVNFKPGYQMSWQTAIGGFGPEIIGDNSQRLTGNHLVDPSFIPGVLFSNKKFDKITAHSLDVSPTIFDFLGIDIPPEMDGKSLLKR